MFEHILNKFKVPALISLAVGILTTGSFWAGTIKGGADAQVRCAESKSSAIVEGVKAHAKIEKEVISLPDVELDRRLDRWMRD